MVPFNDTTSPKPAQHFVDAAPAGHVIVINVPPGEPSARVFGSIRASNLFISLFHYLWLIFRSEQT
jgi:hypothetical protein